jgi:hypothetical protein
MRHLERNFFDQRIYRRFVVHRIQMRMKTLFEILWVWVCFSHPHLTLHPVEKVVKQKKCDIRIELVILYQNMSDKVKKKVVLKLRITRTLNIIRINVSLLTLFESVLSLSPRNVIFTIVNTYI